MGSKCIFFWKKLSPQSFFETIFSGSSAGKESGAMKRKKVAELKFFQKRVSTILVIFVFLQDNGQLTRVAKDKSVFREKVMRFPEFLFGRTILKVCDKVFSTFGKHKVTKSELLLLTKLSY